MLRGREHAMRRRSWSDSGGGCRSCGAVLGRCDLSDQALWNARASPKVKTPGASCPCSCAGSLTRARACVEAQQRAREAGQGYTHRGQRTGSCGAWPWY